MKKLFLISLLVTLPLFASADWSAPLSSPPTCRPGNAGCDAPLNVSRFGQSKIGGITVGTNLGLTDPGLVTRAQVVAGQLCFYGNGTPPFSCIGSWSGIGGGGGGGSNVSIGGPVTINELSNCVINAANNSITCTNDGNSSTLTVNQGGISRLTAGTGIVLTPTNPLTGPGIVSADIPTILTDIGNCGPNKVLQGFNQTTKVPICVEKIQCTGSSCPVPTGLTGSGTTGRIPKWTGGTMLGDSKISESGGALNVGGITMSGTDPYGVIRLISNRLNIFAGNPGAGKILTATDTAGDVSWRTKEELGLGDAFWEKVGTSENIKNKNIGNIGIGVSDPQAKVDVSGQVRIRPGVDTPITGTIINRDPPGPALQTGTCTPVPFRSTLDLGERFEQIMTDGQFIYTRLSTARPTPGSWFYKLKYNPATCQLERTSVNVGISIGRGDMVLATGGTAEKFAILSGFSQVPGAGDGPVRIVVIDTREQTLNAGPRVPYEVDLTNSFITTTPKLAWKVGTTFSASRIFLKSVPCFGTGCEPVYGGMNLSPTGSLGDLYRAADGQISLAESENGFSELPNSVSMGGMRYSISGDGLSIQVSNLTSSGKSSSLLAQVSEASSAFINGVSNLFVGSSETTTNYPVLLDVGGRVRIGGGNPASNKVLASDDTNGTASWKTLTELGSSSGCTISGNTITCGGNTLTIPTSGSNSSCTISGNSITCGGQTLTVPTSTGGPTTISSYRDLPKGALAGFGIYTRGPGLNWGGLTPPAKSGSGFGVSSGCEEGWKTILFDQGATTRGGGPQSSNYTCMKE